MHLFLNPKHELSGNSTKIKPWKSKIVSLEEKIQGESAIYRHDDYNGNEKYDNGMEYAYYDYGM